MSKVRGSQEAPALINPRIAFFVQNNQVEQLTAPVAEYAHEHGYELHDRSSTSELNVDACDIDWSLYDVVIAYGSVQFLRQIKLSQSLGAYALHDEHAFSASLWMPLFKELSLNGSGFVMPARHVDEHLSDGTSLHLRPDSVDKAFPGGVYDQAAWSLVQEDRKLSGDLDCWVSPLQTIRSEYRCWIIGGQVVEISRYRLDDNMSVHRIEDERLFAEAQRLANIYVPAPCVVMDMAMTETGYKLIEFNPIHSSGWYAANVKVVLDHWVAWYIKEFPFL